MDIYELNKHLRKGEKACLYDWPDDEYIIIHDGYYLDELGNSFTLTPTQIDDEWLEYKDAIK